MANGNYFLRTTSILVITQNIAISPRRVYSSIIANWLKNRSVAQTNISLKRIQKQFLWTYRGADTRNICHSPIGLFYRISYLRRGVSIAASAARKYNIRISLCLRRRKSNERSFAFATEPGNPGKVGHDVDFSSGGSNVAGPARTNWEKLFNALVKRCEKRAPVETRSTHPKRITQLSALINYNLSSRISRHARALMRDRKKVA